MNDVRCHLLIKGRVQGVFYRASTQLEATRLRLRGWVRNLDDGGVEAEVEGPQEIVDQLVAWCWKGPPAAHVDDVSVERRPYTGEFRDFSVRY